MAPHQTKLMQLATLTYHFSLVSYTFCRESKALQKTAANQLERVCVHVRARTHRNHSYIMGCIVLQLMRRIIPCDTYK